MAYKKNAAYDLSLFDEETAYNHGSAAPQRIKEPVRKEKTHKKGSKVVSLPQDKLNEIRRRRHNPVKLLFGSLGGLAVAFVIGIIIVGQVRITELNDNIISAKSTLAQTQSVYTETEMKVSADLSDTVVEDYAENVLGMTKASNTQKEFVSLSGGDKAEVSAQVDENIFTQFFDSIKSLWS